MKLPEVDVDAISSLDEAKQVIRVLLNSFEQLFVLYEKQQEKIILLEQELAHLKKQPKKPQFPLSQQANTTPTQLLKENHIKWQKSKRGKSRLITMCNFQK